MPDDARAPEGTAARVGSILDANVHLWDQATNPVFWLSDRTMLVDMLGSYDALPDRYSLADYERDASGFSLAGAIWSDPGAADPIKAIDQVHDQNETGTIVGIVTLADPAASSFPAIVERARADLLVTAVRIRLVASLQSGSGGGVSDAALADRLGALVDARLVAVVEASADQLERVLTLAGALPDLRIVVDHFGWPTDLSDAGRTAHLARLRELAAAPHLATRIDALGTIFGAWTVDQVRPWVEGTIDAFGSNRCMIGTDYPIESLRTSYADLYGAYDEMLRDLTPDQREDLFSETAHCWLDAAGVRPEDDLV